jgi:hypothetical protein
MKRFSIILTVFFFILTSLAGNASVSFSAQAPRQVVQGNKFNVTYVLQNAEGSSLSVPEINGAIKLYGPAISTSYSSSWSSSGSSSSNSSQEYTMIYKANKAGKYRVGPATIVANGRRYSTRPFVIEILTPDRAAVAASRQRNTVQYDDPMTQTSDKSVKGNDLFVRISMSKQHVYEQEAVVCTIKLYTKYKVSQFMPTLQPSFNGFLIEELPLSPNLNNVERVNGQNYMVAELKKCILFPQQSGKLTITSGNYDVAVVQYETYRTPFGTLSQPVEKKLQVKSNSASVYIDPLPEPKPANFSGAVGNFSVQAFINPKSLKTYAAATYSYIVRGTGNIKYIKAPTIKFPSQFDVYDPQNKVAAAINGSNVSGSVKFDYTFIPQYVGKYDIPSSDFVYFNPETKKYVTLHPQSFHLAVAKGSGSPSSHYKGLQQQNDILYISTGNFALSKSHGYIVNGFGYWLWFIIPLLIFASILVYYRKQLKERSNLKLMKTKYASKVAQKRLKLAKKFMLKNDRNQFYAEMLNAIWGYMSDKLGIPGSELSRDNISAELEKYGVDEALRKDSIDLLDKCEFAQYAPELAQNDMNQVYNEGASLMDKLENIKRIKPQL